VLFGSMADADGVAAELVATRATLAPGTTRRFAALHAWAPPRPRADALSLAGAYQHFGLRPKQAVPWSAAACAARGLVGGRLDWFKENEKISMCR